MKKFFCIIMSLTLFFQSYCAMKPGCCPSLPKMVIGSDAYSRFICSEEKAEYFNNLMERLWNKDFGKFLQAFCICFFKKSGAVNPSSLELQKTPFTSYTIELAEFIMFYLCTASFRKCLEFFDALIDFFKHFWIGGLKKKIISESLREFACCSLIGLCKYSCVTKELIAEKHRIIGELFDEFD